MTDAATHRHLASIYQAAADLWSDDGSRPHAEFAPVLQQWAANASRRALEAESVNQPDLFGDFK